MHIYTHIEGETIIQFPGGCCEQVLEIEDYVGFFSKTLKLSDQSYLERFFNIFRAPGNLVPTKSCGW